MSDSFTWSRFGFLLRYLGIMNLRSYIKQFVASVIGIVLLYLFQTHLLEVEEFNRTLLSTEGFFLFLMGTVCCASLFGNTARNRNAFGQLLMLPVSQVEKFWGVVVMKLVAPILSCALGFVVGTLCVEPSSVGDAIRGLVLTLHFVTDNVHDANADHAFLFAGQMLVITSIFMTLSFFTLVGLVFSKAKWILAVVIQGGVTALISYGIVRFINTIDWSQYDINFPNLYWWIDGINVLLGVLFFFLSFKLFKSQQAVFGKLFCF
ncbi:MAG: hypothetical protein PUD36_09750 [Bacteroidales bacterium]|nr:hypothetical protein [Bacteroidales bacterium]